MAPLPSKTFQQFVDDMVAQWAAQLQAAGALPPGVQPVLQKGDALFATMQAVASQMVFLQALAQMVNAVARAQTSAAAGLSGDVDTFLAQFGFARLPATFASGAQTFSKLSPAASQVLVAPGVVVQTIGGAVSYAVVGDANRPTWNAGLNAYVLAPGQTTLTATVVAVLSGSAQNVTAGQLSQLGSAVPGIDTTTNAAPIANGQDAEGDTAALARFVLFLNSLSKATYGAIVSAISGVSQAVRFNLLENINLAGASQPGEFVSVIDDGSGTPPASLVANVQAAINAVRGFTILGLATAVTGVIATIVLSVRVAAGFNTVAVEAAVANAVAAAVNASAVGGTLYVVSTIERAALAVAGVVSVQPGVTTINGVGADLAVTGFQKVKTDINHVTVGSY